MFNPENKVFFPSTWVEALAFEYAKAHVAEAGTPVDFANIYIEAANQICKALSASLGGTKSGSPDTYP